MVIANNKQGQQVSSNLSTRESGENASLCCATASCTCNSLLPTLVSLTDNTVINITTDVVLTSIVPIEGVENITILGYNNPTVYCRGNGALRFTSSNNVTVEGIVWEECGSNNSPTLGFYNSSKLTIRRCTFEHSQYRAIQLFNVFGYVSISTCIFAHNNLHIKVHGSAILYSSLYSQSNLTIGNCYFAENGEAKSVIYFYGNSNEENKAISLQNSIFINNQVLPVFVFNHNLHISGNVSFNNNIGGGIMSHNSNITFTGNSAVKFHNNSANYGGAINSDKSSAIFFTGHCRVNFTANNAGVDGGALYSVDKSVISFEGGSFVTFVKNLANWGGAIYSKENSRIFFKGNSKVACDRNGASLSGGAVYTDRNSVISFQEQSVVNFDDNFAECGGAIFYFIDCSLLFEGHSKVTFNKNNALKSGGAIYSDNNYMLSFKEYTEVTFTENIAGQYGGAIINYKHNNVSFEGESIVEFKKNEAKSNGGAIHSSFLSLVSITEQSEVIFLANKAIARGGALFVTGNSKLLITNNSRVSFTQNTAIEGGSMCFQDSSTASFDGNSTVSCKKNTATQNGAAVYSGQHSDLLFAGKTTVRFVQNNATLDGGTIFLVQNCTTTFEEHSTVSFVGNSVTRYGGALYSDDNSEIFFKGSSSVMFHYNSAMSGGAIHSRYSSDVSFKGSSVVRFAHNTALKDGGALHITSDSDVIIEGTHSLFNNNTALNGGAVFMVQSMVTSTEESIVTFSNNTALDSGGAVYLSDHTQSRLCGYATTFFNNLAYKYGGAVYAVIDKSVQLNISDKFFESFLDNSAKVAGNKLYLAITKSCDFNCVSNSVSGISKEVLKSETLSNGITTTPKKVKYYHPAVCINKNNASGECQTYYLNNIILGQEISVEACVRGYFDRPSRAVQMIVSSGEDDDHKYKINGARDLQVLCGSNAFQGISITGNRDLSVGSFNASITIHFHIDLFSDEVQFSTEFVLEISPCHPGFCYHEESQKCTCYDHNNLILCSSTSSVIKRGYWFGSVNGQPTVAVCPVNYCDFSCCETTDGYYSLSPLRLNQCRSHRSGPACGSCEEGWTLSFDSAECVKTDKCTAGQTALVVTLTVLYWVSVVAAVFVMMYFKISIGYLYAITYYYSILDTLLNQTLYLSQHLLTTFNTVASMFKITPQFLGQFCLLKGMSGIDQHFIHFVHPFAVTLILIIIILQARVSYRFSSFISRGIIHVICLLLLLSYTSVATTSLLLMRTLTFSDVDKIYTYLSPDIEYFHGRHLPYSIVAVLCTLVIVIGLPLLLLVEPFLNQRISFTRIKPLLDQFQGCYKDKYRYFAAYYMICRLVIIIMIITTPSNNVVVQYTLTGTCTAMAAVHLILRPYKLNSLNTFDGLILLLIIWVSIIPLPDSSETDALVGVSLFVVLLPLILFVIMLILTCKNNISKIVTYFKPNHSKGAINTDTSVTKFDIIVDDEMRRNATICDM